MPAGGTRAQLVRLDSRPANTLRPHGSFTPSLLVGPLIA
jgi:hypothetical protein